MMSQSKIEWTDATWNPVVGCTKIAAGCKNCYAERMAWRLVNMGIRNPEYLGVVDENGWTGKIECCEHRLEQPIHWRKPRMIFVCSMSDLFHERVPAEFILKVLVTAAQCPQHTFQILTKRPQRAYDILSRFYGISDGTKWPFPNVWLGVSCSGPDDLWMIEKLRQIPASVRFVSLEPLLNAIRIPQNALRSLDWVIVGGESGPGARPMHPQWVRNIRDQCIKANVPFFFKQWGKYVPGSQLTDVKLVRYLRSCKVVHCEHEGNKALMYGAGKKKAGRILDGRTWDEMPDRTNK